ncbi:MULTISPECIES: plasmid pRiA4b ORF-3 family protein [unclassified Halanaerobium]|uniref:plasmid pRiA4b ORF-3 family protein n=1 Tax=unclassified Halanaerobium TaxID=2641197 RepID=UPI000DF3262D|nr:MULTISPECIES: plasmid pRiA4b ORF-3 family protein [unclassified Halanaerobium]RCW46659.1 pRiA4b ORF-3-like protein [Halanaerobium sp. MA284_MarDTE_T2]RCW83506.1 pRiA4b ORF-3-like protein [Halanaerobium sp. DL-01]
MLIQATKKLRDELNLEEFEQKERPALFSWHANFLRINRRKTVVLVNDACDYTVILYGVKKDDLNHFPDRVKEGIKRSFEREGIKGSLIEKYLSQFEDFFYQKAKNRSHIARMNNSCKEAKRFADRFNENEIYQPQVAKNINNMLRKNDNKDYFYPDKSLQQELAEYYGEKDVIETKAAVLKVELELGKYEAWRKVIVPLSYTFRELHNVLQKLYNWQDYHLHEFFVYSEEKDDTKNWNHGEYHRNGYKAILNLTINQDNLEYNKYELNYQDEDFELAVENEVKLKDVLPARIKYIYDYGDNWQHYLETEKIIEDYKSNQPTFLEGDGTAPPEDVGGVGGFDEFMQIISNPEHEDYESMLEWAKNQRFKEYDPEEIKTKLERHF